MKYKSLIGKFLPVVLLFSGCNLGIDFGGFFYSYSTPDSRFAEKDTLSTHSDTTPLLGAPPAYSFTVISDIHVMDDSASHLAQFAGTMVIAGDKFILDCGDSTQSGYEAQFQTYRNLMNSSGLPWFAAIGNHDLYHEGWKYYKNIVGRSVYSFHIGNSGESGSAYVIALDSANSTLGRSQMNWLEQTLQSQSGLWDHLIVFTHSQFFSTGLNTVVQFSDTEEIYKLMYLFKTYAVDYVFMGHNHEWDERKIGNVNYITLEPLKKEGSDDSFVRVTVTGSDISHERIVIPEL